MLEGLNTHTEAETDTNPLTSRRASPKTATDNLHTRELKRMAGEERSASLVYRVSCIVSITADVGGIRGGGRWKNYHGRGLGAGCAVIRQSDENQNTRPSSLRLSVLNYDDFIFYTYRQYSAIFGGCLRFSDLLPALSLLLPPAAIIIFTFCSRRL